MTSRNPPPPLRLPTDFTLTLAHISGIYLQINKQGNYLCLNKNKKHKMKANAIPTRTEQRMGFIVLKFSLKKKKERKKEPIQKLRENYRVCYSTATSQLLQ